GHRLPRPRAGAPETRGVPSMGRSAPAGADLVSERVDPLGDGVCRVGPRHATPVVRSRSPHSPGYDAGEQGPAGRRSPRRRQPCRARWLRFVRVVLTGWILSVKGQRDLRTRRGRSNVANERPVNITRVSGIGKFRWLGNQSQVALCIAVSLDKSFKSNNYTWSIKKSRPRLA